MGELIGTTARPITFVRNGHPAKHPAGVEVYVSPGRRYLRIRVPGTLLEQDVTASSVLVP